MKVISLIKVFLQWVLSVMFPFDDVTATSTDELQLKMTRISIQNTMDDMRPKL